MPISAPPALRPSVPPTTRTGILLLNLGTPDAPRADALRRYLAEFLSDRRVVELPRLLWWPILYGIILPLRAPQSARKYAAIWDAQDGSPLRFHTERQARLLEGWLGLHTQAAFSVEHAMRYGQPDIAGAIDRLLAAGCTQLFCLPLYPQYAASSSASAIDGVLTHLLHLRRQPTLRTLSNFHDHPGYIAALAAQIGEYWRAHGRPDVLVMSFHGIPLRSVTQGDPYHEHCLTSARLLAEALQLPESGYRIAFQSRFGRARWIEPSTAATLAELGQARTSRVDVICPGFVSDCLETLEEIAMEGRQTFVSAGGGDFRYIPALNEHNAWIETLGRITLEHCTPWL